MRVFKREVKRYLADKTPAVVHVHIPVKAGIIGFWLKRKFGIPMVVTEHLGIYNNLAPDNYFKRSRWFKHLTKRVIKNANVFLPVSKNSGDLINKIVVAKPFTVVKNVVDTRLFYFNPTDNTPLFWVVHVSMMNHPKNPKGLLRAFALAVKQNNNIRLRMIGNVNDELIVYTAELGISDFVIYTGMLPQEKVAPLVQQSDAFLLFSIYENMPCVLAEALCCGLPVIATNVGGISEIITEQNGILIESQYELACAEAIVRMSLDKNNFKKQLIAQNAASIFSYEVIGRQLSEVYKQIGR
jgi:glycosyltransferase involved in cell wall biosynthesis